MTLCFLLLFSVDQKAETDRHLIMAAIVESFRVKAHIKASLKINLTHVFDFLMITDWMSDSLTIDSFRYIFRTLVPKVQLVSPSTLTQVLYLCLFDLNVMAEA